MHWCALIGVLGIEIFCLRGPLDVSVLLREATFLFFASSFACLTNFHGLFPIKTYGKTRLGLSGSRNRFSKA